MNVHITKSGLCCGRDGVVCAQYAGADPCIVRQKKIGGSSFKVTCLREIMVALWCAMER